MVGNSLFEDVHQASHIGGLAIKTSPLDKSKMEPFMNKVNMYFENTISFISRACLFNPNTFTDINDKDWQNSEIQKLITTKE